MRIWLSRSALIVPLLISVSAIAETHLVKPDGTGDFATIQDAIDAASDNDIVELEAGVFTGPGNRDIDYLGKSVTVRSGSGDAEACIIDCNGTEAEPHRGFHFHTDESEEARLECITVRNGVMSGAVGGAIRIHGASPTIIGCVFQDNSAWAGGAVSIDGLATPLFEGCVFEGNSADSGGGLAHLWGYTGTGATIVGSVFRNNHARGGGALSCSDRGTITLDSSLLVENSAEEFGGAISLVASRIAVSYCIFWENNATQGAGAIFSGWGSGTTIDHCTFVGNQSRMGSVILTDWDCSVILSKSILAFNRGSVVIECGEAVFSLTITCCDLFGNPFGNWWGCIEDGEGVAGNMEEDPLFCDQENGDFGLRDGSPCSPDGSPECGLVGAKSVGCETSVLDQILTWGRIKAGYR